MTKDKYITAKEVQSLLGYKQIQSVYRAAKIGVIRKVKKLYGRTLYLRAEIETMANRSGKGRKK